MSAPAARADTTVAIQPAYGDVRTRQHFADSLDHGIRYSTDDRWRHLTDRQRKELSALHPGGRSHFWGGTRSQAAKIIQLRRGDLVLLTGQLHVRGVGEVGAVLDNEPFARSIWAPHPHRCSFATVYSLVWFRRVEVPYQVLQEALGSSERDHFQALRLVRDERRVAAVRTLVDEGLL